MRSVICSMLLLLAFGPAGQLVRADDPEAANAKLYHRLLRSTVWINFLKRTDPGGKRDYFSGTAAVLDLKRRLAVTNYHVVRDKEEGTALFATLEGGQPVTDRSRYGKLVSKGIPVKVVARDKPHDLAVIELASLPNDAVPLGLADGVKVEQRVYSVGNPAAGKLWTFRTGTVLKLGPEKFTVKAADGFELMLDTRIIQTTIRTEPGESGGPLVNEQGELVGVLRGTRKTREGDKEIEKGIVIDGIEVKALLEEQKLK
jgi:S1-C subfamily serine protease